MADEQLWGAYADRAYFLDTDIALIDDGSGGGFNVPMSAVLKKNAAGRFFASQLLAIGTDIFSVAVGYGHGLAFSSDPGANSGGVLWHQPINTDDHRIGLTNNAINSGPGAWKRLGALQSSTMYETGSGVHRFFTAGAGAAGSAIVWSEVMSLGNAGMCSITPTVTPTTAADAKQLQLAEATTNPNYRMNLGYYVSGGVYRGVVQVLSGGVGAGLLLNPAGGPVAVGHAAPGYELDVKGQGNDSSVFIGSTANAFGTILRWNNNIGYGVVGTIGSFPLQFWMNGGVQWSINTSGHLAPGSDNTRSLATAALRASVVFSATGAINTSDAREKAWLGGLAEAHIRAARRICAELGFYQWLAEIAAKGEDQARIHFGPRAQEVWRVLAEEGLEQPIIEDEPPSARHAFLCYDEWDEECEPIMATRMVEKTRSITVTSETLFDAQGNPAQFETTETYEEEETYDTGETRVTLEAGDRYGIRPDQLAFFLIAAQEQRLLALEAA